MKKIPRWLRRLLYCLIGLILLASIFYGEEYWRGKRAWDDYKRGLEAKGFAVDWSKYIPPAIPDDENVFKAPKMTEWFVKKMAQTTNELTLITTTNPQMARAIGNPDAIKSGAEAKDFLEWSDGFVPDFNLIRDALKRPSARMDGDYSIPYQIPIPNFIAVRTLAQVLAERAHCYYLLNEPDKALDELTLMHDLRGVLQPPPNGKPITLVAAMINVAVAGLYADTIAEGFKKNVWQEKQLVVLQKQLADTDVMPWVLDALKTEPAASCRAIEGTPVFKIFNFSATPNWGWKDKLGSWLFPRGWIYQNMVTIMTLEQKPLSGFDAEKKTVSPQILDEAMTNLQKSLAHKTPYNIIAEIAVPNFTKAWQTTAHNQTTINEAQIACALERYKIAHGEYPLSISSLSPQFIEKIPHDIIGGRSLIYLPPTTGEKYLLYSVGWNEKDDGGMDSSKVKNATQYVEGDWVWKN